MECKKDSYSSSLHVGVLSIGSTKSISRCKISIESRPYKLTNRMEIFCTRNLTMKMNVYCKRSYKIVPRRIWSASE